MNAKHLTKNAMSHKLVFLAVGIAIAMIAAFSICATSQAKAETNDANDGEITVFTENPFNGNDLSPIYGVFADNLGSASQYTIPADKLTSIKGAKIKGLKYYVSTFYGQWSGAFKVYIAEVNESTPSVFLDKTAAGAENVFTGQVTITNSSEMTVNFEKPYTYNGGNLAIEFVCSQDGNYPQNVFLSEMVSGGTICRANQSAATDVHDCAPKTTLFYDGGSSGVNISGQVIDEQTGRPVPFANVAYCQYNPWWGMYIPVEGVEPVQTDMWGFYTLEGVTEEMRPGKVLASRWGYVFDGGESDPVGWWLPEGIETIWRTVQLTPIPDIDLADVEINGGSHHANFVTTYEFVKNGKVVESDSGTFDKITHKIPVGSSYAVYDDGTLHCSYAFPENGTTTSIAYTVKAVAEEGYVLDKWNINGEDLVPGNDYILKADDVMGLASYKLAEQPVPPVPPTPPTPGPTPVNPGGGIAQTSDATPFTAIAVLGIVAALGCGVALRKEYF